MKTAVQQIMLGSITKTEKMAAETLAAVKKAGYDGIELNGFMIQPTSFLVRTMTKMAGMPVGKGGNFNWPALTKEAGLAVVSLHQDLGTVAREPEKVIRQAKEFGTEYVVITGMYRFDYSDEQAVAGLVSELNHAGDTLKKSGLKLVYHNHNCEFRKLPSGQTAYQFLLSETDESCVNFEFDSYWPAEAGVDVPELMKQLGTRMRLYHINDRGTRICGPSMTPILKSDSMELGCGNMNLTEMIAQAKTAGTEAVILETHKNWADKSPLKSLEISAEFLKRYL